MGGKDCFVGRAARFSQIGLVQLRHTGLLVLFGCVQTSCGGTALPKLTTAGH